MSAHERQAYQRLLAAYNRRLQVVLIDLQILTTCEKILKLCGNTPAPTSALNHEESSDMMIDDNAASGLEDTSLQSNQQFGDDPHYFNTPRQTESIEPLDVASLRRLDICQAFSNAKLRQDITCRPFVGVRARLSLTDHVEAPSSFQNGDVFHVPFSADEMRIMFESAKEYGGTPNCKQVSKVLRGRTANDVRHAWVNFILKDDRHDVVLKINDELIPDRYTLYFDTDKVLQQRNPLILRETEQTGEKRARIGRWISRQGYIHAECTFRLQLEDALNEIVTGPSEDTSHIAVIVGSGNTREGAGSPFALDLRDKSTYPLLGHNGIVTEASFSFDGRYIMTGSDDKTVCIFDSDLLRHRHTLRTTNEIIRVEPHKSEPVFAVASSNSHSITTVNAESLVAHSTRLQFEDTLLDFAFGSAGTCVQNHLVAGFQNQKSVYKYQLTSIGLRRVTQMSEDNKVFLVRSIPITAAAYASCFFYSTESDDQLGSDKIKIWDARDPEIKTVTIRSHTKRGRHMIGDMSVSPDGRYLQTSGTDSCVCISDLRRLGSKPLLVLKHQCDIGQPTDGVATEWSRDSRFLVTGADDCTVRIWDLHTNDYDADNVGLIRVIDGNASGEGCIHIVANINHSNGFIYGTKLGNVVAFEQNRHSAR